MLKVIESIKIRKMFIKLLCIILFPIRLLPVGKIIAFESHSDYCDNSKVFSDYLIKKNINCRYKLVWFIENADLKKIIKIDNLSFVIVDNNNIINSIISEYKKAFILSRCSFYFYTHRNYSRYKPKQNQVFFNFTHGTSFKDTTGKHNELYKSSYILSTSPFAANLRTMTYGGGLDQIKLLGFPRNDLLFQSKYSKKTDFLVVWLPTFRRQKGKNRNDSGTVKEFDLPIISSLCQLYTLNNYLCSINTELIIKPHPAQNMKYFINVKLSNIKIYTNDDLSRLNVDLYELLGSSDALITDYSSVFIDYLILDKPICFTIDDYEGYKNNIGFLIDNPLSLMPGDKVTNIEEMILFFNYLSNGKDMYTNQRETVTKLFHDNIDGCSCQRIYKFIKI